MTFLTKVEIKGEVYSSNTAFIGLDYINDVMHPEDKIASVVTRAAERCVVNAANRAMAIARSKEWLTILVKVGFTENFVDRVKQSRLFGSAHELSAIELGAGGTQFRLDLNESLADIVIVRPRVSGFYCTNLAAILRARKVKRLVIAGASNAWAVQSTVRDAHDRDYQVFVLEDACAASNETEHCTSMNLLGAVSELIRVDDLFILQ